VTRVGIVLDPDNSSLAALRRATEVAAPRLGVQAISLGVHNANEIERGISGFAEQQNGGLIVLANPVTIRNRDLIIVLAARYRLPAIYMFRISRPAADYSHMESINSTNGAAPPDMSIGSSRAKTLVIYQCKRRRSIN